jgi:putative mRNA 3-end processing factor
VLGSAQIAVSCKDTCIVASGDYKDASDPTCAPFEVVRCDVFITEATFGLPVFRHGDAADEVKKLLASVALFPERAHLVGAYSLGKAQRVIALLRLAGYDAPIYLHGALVELCSLYQSLGVDLGDLRPATTDKSESFAGALVLCPPSAVDDRWSRRFPDPVTAFASGWMRIKGRIRQSGVELPLVISDHADWPELLDTIVETGAEDVWVTHGRDDALVYQLGLMGRKARALSLVGFEDEGE